MRWFSREKPVSLVDSLSPEALEEMREQYVNRATADAWRERGNTAALRAIEFWPSLDREQAAFAAHCFIIADALEGNP